MLAYAVDGSLEAYKNAEKPAWGSPAAALRRELEFDLSHNILVSYRTLAAKCC